MNIGTKKQHERPGEVILEAGALLSILAALALLMIAFAIEHQLYPR